MLTVPIQNLKATAVFKQGYLPQINPNNPTLILDLQGTKIGVAVTPKAARKLATHTGAAVLQGRLVMQAGALVLLDAGFTLIDPRPAQDGAGVANGEAAQAQGATS